MTQLFTRRDPHSRRNRRLRPRCRDCNGAIKASGAGPLRYCEGHRLRAAHTEQPAHNSFASSIVNPSSCVRLLLLNTRDFRKIGITAPLVTFALSLLYQLWRVGHRRQRTQRTTVAVSLGWNRHLELASLSPQCANTRAGSWIGIAIAARNPGICQTDPVVEAAYQSRRAKSDDRTGPGLNIQSGRSGYTCT